MAESLSWVDARDLLEATGARNLSRSGNELTFSCMSGAHAHGDATPSAGMNVLTTLWRCRNPACGLHGNAVDYIVALKGYTRSEALRVLQERYGGPEQSVEAGALETEVQRIRAQGQQTVEPRSMISEAQYLDRFAVHWPDYKTHDLPEPMGYMIGRGFSPKILNDWQIGYDDISRRITIPVYDEDGELVGIKGRAWWPDAHPKYIILGDPDGRLPRYGFQTYHKSQYVFGLDRASDNRAVICEGELNVIALAQMGITAVAVAGAEFSDRQAQLIIEKFSEVTIYFDPDLAGETGVKKVGAALSPYMSVGVVEDQVGDAAEGLQRIVYGYDDVRDWIDAATSWLRTSVGR